MKRTIMAAMILLGLLFFLTQCARNSGNPVGDDFFERQFEGDQLFAVFYPAPSDTFYHSSVNSGIGPYLNIGQSMGIESKFLMQFTDLPDSGIMVQQAILTLHPHRIMGDRAGSFIASISKITDEWIEAYHEYVAQYEPVDQLFPWSQRRLEYLLEDIGEEAGLKKHLSFDMCRWTCSLVDYKNGMEHDRIRQKLGISKIQWREIRMKLRKLNRDE